jgi:hypothetical protein
MSYGRKINPGGYPVVGRKGEDGGILYPVLIPLTATEGQTAITGLPPFQPGHNLVFLWKNSEFLISGEEFIEVGSTGLEFTLSTEPCKAGDRLIVLIFYVNSAYGVVGEPAGGVLSGTYPNPGFAVDMATQAELNQLIADVNTLLALKANRNGDNAMGTWPISITGAATSLVSLAGLPQDGAAPTHVLTWNGVNWVPAAPTGGGGGPATPTGPAGGALMGTYPNPELSVRHATKGELDALEATVTENNSRKAVSCTLSSVKAASIGTSPANVTWNNVLEQTGGNSLASGFTLVGSGGSILQSIQRKQPGIFVVTVMLAGSGSVSGQLVRIARYLGGSTAGLGTPVWFGGVRYVPTVGFTATLETEYRFRNNPTLTYGFAAQVLTVGGTFGVLATTEHGPGCQFTVEFIPD